MKLAKISDIEEKWINPEKINGIHFVPTHNPPTTYITTNYFKYETELTPEQVIQRIQDAVWL